LRQKSQPRLLLFVILVFTGIVGAVSSFVMLHIGLGAIYVRYPIAALIAYLVFLLLLHLWQSRLAHQPDLPIHLHKIGTEPSIDDTPNVQIQDNQGSSKRSYLDALDALDLLNIFDDPPGLLMS